MKSLHARVAALTALREHAVGPMYGHLKLETAGHVIDVLIGGTTKIAGVSTLDWKQAPLAQVFFDSAEGDEYELEVGDRLISGRVLEKNVTTFDGPKLTRLQCGLGLWGGEPWPPLKARPEKARRPFRSPLEVELDPAQRRVVERPADSQLLILGEAGFGKTTVALLRLLRLKEHSGRKNFRAAVVVPTTGLARLTELMLARKGAEDVEVWTYDAYAMKAARRAFPDLPHKTSQSTSAELIALKRHGALEHALADFVEEHPSPAQDEDRPTRSHARATRADLEQFFGDTKWMEKAVADAKGAIPARAVKDAVMQTRAQFRDPAEVEFAHVDAANVTAVDGRSLDEGTPNEDAGTFDLEDAAVLFEMARLRAVLQRQKPAVLTAFDALLIDEAQEFAPLELRLLGRTLNPRGSLIVAGDAAQQVDPTSHFAGWEKVMDELGAAEHERAVLEINYRCPPEVTAYARSLVGLGPPVTGPEPAITRALHDNGAHLVLWLTDELRRIRAEDPNASIAVVCRSDVLAKSLAHTLGYGMTVRLALEGEFEFSPGVTVTSVQEVKGLEFDVTIVPDAQASMYPDTPASRRMLYVAVTRATHHLGLAAVGKWFSDR